MTRTEGIELPNNICPRCAGLIPNALHPGQYVGALSRWDNMTYVCSECGEQEALIQFTAAQEGTDPQEAIDEDRAHWFYNIVEMVMLSNTAEEAIDTIKIIARNIHAAMESMEEDDGED